MVITPSPAASQIFGIGNTYTLSPTLINEFRVSFTRQFLTTHPDHPVPNSISDQSAVQQLMATSQIPDGWGYPSPSLPFPDLGGPPTLGDPPQGLNVMLMAEAYTILDNVTKVKGRHTVTAGFMYRLEHTTTNGQFPTYIDNISAQTPATR